MPRPRTHDWIDRRSLALARATAAKLRADPSLMQIARDNLHRWKSQMDPWPPALAEWEAILQEDFDSIIAQLIEDSERGQRRRQSDPFPGVLTPEERQAIFDQYESLAA
jgi:hypothetical protein